MFVSFVKAKERYSICKSCEYLTAIKNCEKCRCFMPAKTTISITKCPIDKWGPEESVMKEKNYKLEE